MHLGRPISLPAARLQSRALVRTCNSVCTRSHSRGLNYLSNRIWNPLSLSVHGRALETPDRSSRDYVARRFRAALESTGAGFRHKNPPEPPLEPPSWPVRCPSPPQPLSLPPEYRSIRFATTWQSAASRHPFEASAVFFNPESSRELKKHRTNESHEWSYHRYVGRYISFTTIASRRRLRVKATHYIVAKSPILDRSRERSPIAPRAFASEIAPTIGRETRRCIDRKFITADINNSSYNRDATRSARRSIELSIGQLYRANVALRPGAGGTDALKFHAGEWGAGYVEATKLLLNFSLSLSLSLSVSLGITRMLAELRVPLRPYLSRRGCAIPPREWSARDLAVTIFAYVISTLCSLCIGVTSLKWHP